MPLTTGSRVGSFEILAPLGEGGMGEVYRARDTRLDRSVAIKSLPAAFASDPERLARFEREAKLLAALSHPNIAGIHGLEDVGGAPYLVLEYVEGETLAARLARGPLPVREALEVGIQVAAAMEVAHERGIVHRDLKPGNVMLTPARTVKVLDFGLARGGALEARAPDSSVAATLALSETGAGVILGTAAYMSPEQARGLAVDRRTDVWGFGCVLYECLAGRQAFAGRTISDVIARVLEREPDWAALPGDVPPRLRDLVRRCLTKEQDERPRDIGDLRRELSAIAAELSAPRAAASGLPSVAVLYFENLSSDDSSNYFCSGMTEDILTDLSKIKGLRVASRNAVARYRGAPVDIPKVAAELGVQAVLEGSVRRAGDRVRITVQLINAADGFHLWAERFDRTLEDVFAVQEEIAAAIAGALRVALPLAEAQSIAATRPSDVQAYDLYLKGRERYGQYRLESMREALALFQQALAVDPEYALAWAGVADCYGQLLQWEAGDPAELMRSGLEAARRAIAINPRLAEAHKAEALVLRFGGDLDASRAALQRAVEVNPRFAPALINLGVDEFCLADLAGAERRMRRVIELDPQDAFAVTWVAMVSVFTRRFDEALAAADRVQALAKDEFYVTVVHLTRGWVHLLRGDLPAAARAVREGRAGGADATNLLCVEAALAAAEGRADDARRHLLELENAMEAGGWAGAGSLAIAARAAMQIAEPQRAVALLGRKVLHRFSDIMVRLDPGLHGVLGHPPYTPRRMDATLVWPLEAPMVDPSCFPLFRDMRIESGIPERSDVKPA